MNLKNGQLQPFVNMSTGDTIKIQEYQQLKNRLATVDAKVIEHNSSIAMQKKTLEGLMKKYGVDTVEKLKSKLYSLKTEYDETVTKIETYLDMVEKKFEDVQKEFDNGFIR